MAHLRGHLRTSTRFLVLHAYARADMFAFAGGGDTR
jgi:hypothetical protein